MPQWTTEQEQAIHTTGSDILVAAAAGSGKTAVLVERIIQKLLSNDPVDIDRLLVVTFTNAAAQEMRNRIGGALEKALEMNPESSHLKKQIALLQRASITTLHSFCLDVVRRHAYLLDIDPAFRISDQVESDMIRQEVLEDLFEEWYGKEGQEQEAFFDVVDRFSNDRSDAEVEELILRLYDFAVQNPWPDKWLDDMAAMYKAEEVIGESSPWVSILKKEIESRITAMKSEAAAAMDIVRSSDGPYHYAEAIEEDQLLFETASKSIASSWDEARAFFQESKFAGLSRKKADCSEEKKARVKKIRDSYKKRWSDLKDGWLSRTFASYTADMDELHPTIEQLAVLVKEFKARYTALKIEKALVDFSDLEHYCLQILLEENSQPDDWRPSQVADELRENFQEVLVDEYQDTNLVQETLLSLVSDKEGNGNMFMVGDVKQSIYRFRHAEPALFLNKYKDFASPDHPAKRIDLARNFRSRPEVLSAANYVFRQLLNEEVGEMEYEKEAELIYSNFTYDQHKLEDAETELVIIDREADETDLATDEEENFQDLEKAQLEARAYAKRIKKWMGKDGEPPMKVVDKQTGMQRNIQYRDIVILLRSMPWAATITEELKQQGIPVYAEISTGYLEAIEIKVMLSLLKIIDNPQQDIPLASVLRSPIVGLDEDDLARIRLAKKRAPYYQALDSFLQETEDTEKKKHLQNFLARLDDWRLRARQGALSDLIWQIYRETGYYDFVGGIPGGKQRQANLRALYDRARKYESTSFRGLFRFLRFIDRMEERGDDLGAARALGEQEDVVRIMTIHKSKGLEFPFVILGAMNKQFNQQDLKQKYLLHKDLGFGSKYINPEKRIMYPTLAYHALKAVKQREAWAEEMRVLYVALTRAQEKLVMVGSVNSLEKKQQRWMEIQGHPDWVLPPHYRLESQTYLDWVAPSLIRHEKNTVLRQEDLQPEVPEEIRRDPSRWLVQLLHGRELVNLEEEEEQQSSRLIEAVKKWEGLPDTDPEIDDWVARRLEYTYPFQSAITHRAKQTVTELKRQRQTGDEYSGDQLVSQFKAPIAKRPRFMQETKKLTAAERGNAMHTVMQQLPLTRRWSREQLEEEVAAMVTKEMLTAEETTVIDTAAIEAFFQTELAGQIIQSGKAQREVPFSLSLRAADVYPDWKGESEEHVLVQGIIDCLVPVEEGWVLLDFKTDTLPDNPGDKEKKRLASRYQVQLDLYAQAIEEIWKQPVVKKYVYFFDGALLLDL